MKGYQLHDSSTEEILGSVVVTKQNEGDSDDVFDAWGDWNCWGGAVEKDKDRESVNEFVEWYNTEYESQIEVLDLDFVQP